LDPISRNFFIRARVRDLLDLPLDVLNVLRQGVGSKELDGLLAQVDAAAKPAAHRLWKPMHSVRKRLRLQDFAV
jgi:hypothetical protein